MPVPIVKHKNLRVLWGNIRRLPRLIRRSGFRYFRHSMIRPPYQIYCKGRKAEVFSDGWEFGVYLEVVTNDDYRLAAYSRCLNPRVIADVGANVGLFSKLCSLYFPQAAIYAYEPNPRSFKWLKKNSEGTKIHTYEAAVLCRAGGYSVQAEQSVVKD